MKLKPNWQLILTKAWSMRLIFLSALLSGLEVALPVVQGIIEPLEIIPTGAFAIAAFVTTAAAGVARVVAQPKSGL